MKKTYYNQVGELLFKNVLKGFMTLRNCRFDLWNNYYEMKQTTAMELKHYLTKLTVQTTRLRGVTR